MVIPELTHEQRVESFISNRIPSEMDRIPSKMIYDGKTIAFTEEELAEFCLKEIDYAIELLKSVDVKDVEEQNTD